jgi:hypothetical protein
MASPPIREVNLGSEVDAALQAAIRTVVLSLGGSITEQSYGVGGSQELVRYMVCLPEGNLELESETFIGLTLRGPSPLVEEVARAIQAL